MPLSVTGIKNSEDANNVASYFGCSVKSYLNNLVYQIMIGARIQRSLMSLAVIVHML